ncbi:MAG: hypothetical protein ACRDS1_11340 [Pseudonocardiaceae bacterium]
MIISKIATTPDLLTGALRYLPARAAGIIIGTGDPQAAHARRRAEGSAREYALSAWTWHCGGL